MTRVPAELAEACADVRLAGPDDQVAGRPAAFVAAPASTQEAAALLRAAAAANLSVVPRGSGTKLSWGAAPRCCDLIVDTGRLDAVLEHAAGDLVVRVQAGARLAGLQDKLAAEGQQLSLDPPDGGTIGGVLATSAAGPLRFRYGAPRDLLIGLTVVRADGTIARSGGKVVKNVAGYDLGKLFAGSYGTLGLITEATFRLHPHPAARTWVSLDCPDPQTAAAVSDEAARSPLAPSAVELDWPSAAAPITVAVLLEGDEASVAERAERTRTLLGRHGGGEAPAGDVTAGQAPAGDVTAGQAPAGDVTAGQVTAGPVAPGAIGAGPPAPTLVRIGFWAGQLADVLSTIRRSAAHNQLDPTVSGSAGAGVLHLGLEREVPAAQVGGFVAAVRAGLTALATGTVLPGVASAVVVDAPGAVREAVDLWGPVPSLALMRAVKEQFDPGYRMAPGRFAGGI